MILLSENYNKLIIKQLKLSQMGLDMKDKLMNKVDLMVKVNKLGIMEMNILGILKLEIEVVLEN